MDAALKFTDLPLSAAVQASLHACGFVVPSPIQEKALPVALFGNDLIAQAKSGMGKTLVFACVTVELVLSNSKSWALILAPTREIALQIQHVLTTLIAAIPTLSPSMVVACIGGLDIHDDERRLQQRATRVVVGTPGRVKALVQRKAIPMASMHLFVLDEVDKLMESDFHSDIDAIVQRLPPTKQIVSCSATFTPDQLARLGAMMLTPQFVRVQGPQSVTTDYIQDTNVAAWQARDDAQRPELWLRGVQQFYLVVDTAPVEAVDDLLRLKVQRLAHVLTQVSFHQCIVFCNDKYRAEALADALTTLGFPAVCITGAQAQNQRSDAMDTFRRFQARILVSTDLTARGIDVDRVNLVMNLDLPRDPATYLHRVGRSGRFGGQGVAITLLGDREVKAIKTMAKVFKMKVAEWMGELHAAGSDSAATAHQGDAYDDTDLPTHIFHKRKDDTTAIHAGLEIEHAQGTGDSNSARDLHTATLRTLATDGDIADDPPNRTDTQNANPPPSLASAAVANTSPCKPEVVPATNTTTPSNKKRPSKIKRPPTSPPPTTPVDAGNPPNPSQCPHAVSLPTRSLAKPSAAYTQEEARYDEWLALVHKCMAQEDSIQVGAQRRSC
ncbi:hypothetical protein H310_03937, partial [Aphanomyces invadans]